MRKLFVVLFSLLFLMGITTSAYAAYSGTEPPDTAGAPGYSAPLTDGDDVDNYIGNANSTGKNVTDDSGASVGDVIKSEDMVKNDGTTGTQRTHGEYQTNTNSCASCHQTHTGASKDLLFKQGVYNTCTACHDGTLGFYNVFTGSSAGTFGGTAMGNASVHLADGSVQIKLAPGGNLMETGSNNGTWSENFDCASCHAPHGSYSDRLLHYSPNGMGNVPVANGGNAIKGVPVVIGVQNLPAAPAKGDYVALVVPEGTALPSGEVITTGEDAGTTVAVAVTYDGTKWTRDKTPWLYGYDRHGDPHWTKFYSATIPELKEADVEIEYGKAYAKEITAGAFATVDKADFARAYIVKLGIQDADTAPYPAQVIADFGGINIYAVDSNIYDEPGYGVAIGKYCGACHVDYLARSGGGTSGNGTGMYTVAFRHTTNNDSYNCLKCHYAHGTDVTVMKDALDRDVNALVAGGMTEEEAKAFLLDKNPSSALKRYTNMAVCWKCHTTSKASQLKNNTYYWSGAEVPHGPNNW